jgi:hypothetical protein
MIPPSHAFCRFSADVAKRRYMTAAWRIAALPAGCLAQAAKRPDCLRSSADLRNTCHRLQFRDSVAERAGGWFCLTILPTAAVTSLCRVLFQYTYPAAGCGTIAGTYAPVPAACSLSVRHAFPSQASGCAGTFCLLKHSNLVHLLRKTR